MKTKISPLFGIFVVGVVGVVLVSYMFFNTTPEYPTTFSINGANVGISVDYIITYNDGSQEEIHKLVKQQLATASLYYSEKDVSNIIIRPKFTTDKDIELPITELIIIDGISIKSSESSIERMPKKPLNLIPTQTISYDAGVLTSDSFKTDGKHTIQISLSTYGNTYQSEVLTIEASGISDDDGGRGCSSCPPSKTFKLESVSIISGFTEK